MKGAPLFEVEGLEVRFATEEGSLRAVREVSFRVARGEVLAIVGESGSGKSLSAFAPFGLAAGGPRSLELRGRTALKGGPLLPESPRGARRARGRRVGFVFQDPMAALNPWMRIGAQLAEALPRGRRGRGELERRLEEVGISDARDRLGSYPHELSGGLRQRVLVALALARDPELLVADEPTTALDVTVEAALLDLFRRLVAERGMGLVLVSHDLGVVAGIADRVLVLYAGEVVEDAPVMELFEHPRHPYTQGLLHARPRLGPEAKGRTLPAISGFPPHARAWPAGCAFAARCPHVFAPCAEEAPPMRRLEDGRRVRCHLEGPPPPFPA